MVSATAEELALAIFTNLGGTVITNRHSATLEDILHDISDILSGGGIGGIPGSVIPTLRAGEVSCSRGSTVISFSSALPDTNYIILCTATDSMGTVAFSIDPASYTVNGFTIDLIESALVTYTAIKKS